MFNEVLFKFMLKKDPHLARSKLSQTYLRISLSWPIGWVKGPIDSFSFLCWAICLMYSTDLSKFCLHSTSMT